jgi:hypothetical protein
MGSWFFALFGWVLVETILPSSWSGIFSFSPRLIDDKRSNNKRFTTTCYQPLDF